ncbi:MAG: hypothetical protein EZS28_046046, partial [Streblomastix strix]
MTIKPLFPECEDVIEPYEISNSVYDEMSYRQFPNSERIIRDIGNDYENKKLTDMTGKDFQCALSSAMV